MLQSRSNVPELANRRKIILGNLLVFLGAVVGTAPAGIGQYSSGNSRQVEARFPSSPTASVMTQILTPVLSV